MSISQGYGKAVETIVQHYQSLATVQPDGLGARYGITRPT